MLIYNTTFYVEDANHDHFVIWLKEFYTPEVEKYGVLKSPRLCKLLNYQEDGVAYSLQWEVEDSTSLHRWYSDQGVKLNEELIKIFNDKVIGFPTLMEVME